MEVWDTGLLAGGCERIIEYGTIADARNNGGGKAIISITVTSVTREEVYDAAPDSMARSGGVSLV